MRPSLFKILGLLALVIGMSAALIAMYDQSSSETTVTNQLNILNAQPEAPFVPLADLLAKADLQAGKNVAKQCSACHSFGKGEPTKVGPNLYGIVGASYARSPTYHYSDSMMASLGQTWTLDKLNTFLLSPRAAIPGNKMPFVGIHNAYDRADLLVWLNSLSANPQPIEGK